MSAYTDIVALRKGDGFAAADFGGACDDWNPEAGAATDATRIASLFIETASLSTKVQGRKDDHAYNEGDPVGEALYASICEAVGSGSAVDAATDANALHGIGWHGQVVDKALLHFFYLSVYHELLLGARSKWDEGFGYFGIDFDGAVDNAQGLAATAVKRDGNCGTDYAGTIFDLLIEGRDLLDQALNAEDKPGNDETLETIPDELWDVIEMIDLAMLEVFAISFAREWIGLEAGDKPIIKLIEGRMFFRILKPAIVDYDPTLAADLEAQLEQDDPDQVDTQAMTDMVKTIWDIDVRNSCD